MKSIKNLLLFGLLGLLVFSSFFISFLPAFEWNYRGVDTERVPDFSVYPSEYYIYNRTYLGSTYNHSIYEIVKANVSNSCFGMTSPGTCIYVNIFGWNATSDENPVVEQTEVEGMYWNGTAYYGIMIAIPIDENSGVVTGEILDEVCNYIESMFSPYLVFENKAYYLNTHSFRLWNTTYNQAYFYANFTEMGILTKYEGYLIYNMFNTTLFSKPTQLAPNFSCITDSGLLDVNSTKFKLNITKNDIDSNNDGKVDSDYSYRIYNGNEWSSWTSISPQIDVDLGPDANEADYEILIEVKNMYGVTQEQITIHYTPLNEPNELISGYIIFLVSIIMIFGISFLVLHQRRKSLIHSG